MDGSTSVDIPEQFANVYQQLFNSEDDNDGLEKLRQHLTEAGIHAKDVDLITPQVVQAAVQRLKTGKIDISGEYSSEALLNAPEDLFELLAQ